MKKCQKKKNKTIKELSIEVAELKKEIVHLREYIEIVRADVTLKITDAKEDTRAMKSKALIIGWVKIIFLLMKNGLQNLYHCFGIYNDPCNISAQNIEIERLL